MKQISAVLVTSLSLVLLFTFQNCSEIQSGGGHHSLSASQNTGLDQAALGASEQSSISGDSSALSGVVPAPIETSSSGILLPPIKELAEVSLQLREIEGVLPIPQNLDITGNSVVLVSVRVSGIGMNDLKVEKTVTLADLYMNDFSLHIPRGGSRLIQVSAKVPVTGMDPLEFYGRQEVDISSSIVSLIFPVRYKPPMPI